MLRKKAILFYLPFFIFFSCQPIDGGNPDGSGSDLGSGTGGDENPGIETPEQKPTAGNYSLSLIETTDIHGHIIDVDGEGITHYHLAYVAGRASDIRKTKGEQSLLLLDGGDLYQGASVSNMLAGEPIYKSLDIMGYDAVALGNHEFDWGFENVLDPDATLLDYMWNGVQVENKVPVVCSNLWRYGTRVSSTKDYVIVEKTAVNSVGETVPVKIGIIGSAANYAGSIMTSKFTGAGFSINYNVNNINGIARDLEAGGLCDATILLTHEAANSAAENLGGDSVIDLVLGGHSHQRLSGISPEGVPYLQGGCNCGYYAQASLNFSVDDEGNLSFRSVDDMNVFTVDAAYDTKPSSYLSYDIVEVSDAAVQACSEQFKTVIGYIGISADWSYLSGNGTRATRISNWMCDITRRIGEADVAFVNSGGVRTTFPLDGQPSRNITVANVYEMFPFDNLIYVYDLTYAELLKVFEYSMTNGGSALFSYMTGIECHYIGVENSYGVTEGRVTSLRKDGVTIYESGQWTADWAGRSVRLAVSEYLATTERTDYYTKLPNPLIEWNNTSKLVSNDLVDNVSAVQVLKDEAAKANGRLWIDTIQYFILD